MVTLHMSVEQKAQATKKATKPQKSSYRVSKRSTISPEHTSVAIDGRNKRVWKACERCRMKKTKCDGESPCKRCKDDGLVCTAGSRKKTEFKQVPRGYAEVLENNHFALLAVVHKLFGMLRDGKKWELGEPEYTEHGLPVVHDIAEKLGCIRPSPDLPNAFPETPTALQGLYTNCSELENETVTKEGGRRNDSTFTPHMESEDGESHKHSEYTPGSSPKFGDEDSSSDSDHSEHTTASSLEGEDVKWPLVLEAKLPSHTRPPPPLIAPKQEPDEETQAYMQPDLKIRMPLSPPEGDYLQSFQTEFPQPYEFQDPFSTYQVSEEVLSQSHSLSYTSHMLSQQQAVSLPMSPPSPMYLPQTREYTGYDVEVDKALRNDSMMYLPQVMSAPVQACNPNLTIYNHNSHLFRDYYSTSSMA